MTIDESSQKIEKELKRDHGFWQFNIGHVGTILATVFFVGAAWQSINGKIDLSSQKQDTFQRQIDQQQEEIKNLSSEQQSQRQDIAIEHQDSLDLHKTIDSDLSRRLGKLEDRMK